MIIINEADVAKRPIFTTTHEADATKRPIWRYKKTYLELGLLACHDLIVQRDLSWFRPFCKNIIIRQKDLNQDSSFCCKNTTGPMLR